MSDVDWPLVRELFDALVELPEAERAAHLGRAGVGPGVRAEVERMLRSDGVAIGFLESSSPILEKALLPQMGTRLGRYELKRLIASGGMGTVFEAVQDEPRRAVALKTLRFGLSSPERLQRFRFEAEVLGNLRHPSIAQIFEAGTHEVAGEVVPFIAMELVPGARDILSYAREEDLQLPERLELFLEVCEGVQHGHQKGVIHRDLKPGNILVDAEGQAKVIDFGVARATARSSPFGDGLTQTGQILGTFAYMAPEQLAGSPEAVDVRSDVYALGILLFELIEGRPPHELADKSPFEALRTIQEEPPRPSASTPRELGWILEKALAKEPDHRYSSVSELAADLRRYLRREPVLAGPPSVVYRLTKWIKRNPAKTAAATIGAVTFTIIALLLAANVRRADDVLRLSALQKLEDLTKEADRLWPAHPHNIERFEAWLTRAEALTAELPGHETKLAELRSKSVPWTKEEQAKHRAEHPKLAELERAQRELESSTRLHSVLESGEQSAEPTAPEPGVDLSSEFEGHVAKLRTEIEAGIAPEQEAHREEHRIELETRIAALEAAISERSEWVFDNAQDKWWHSQLEKLVNGLRAFADEKAGLFSEGTSEEHGWGMKKRLASALLLRAGFAPEGEQTKVWSAALPEICAAYPGLALTPQFGLVPLGPDPNSHLWEFAHLQTGVPAVRGPDGKLVLREETGLVFVLLPGGTFGMGAQKDDPSGPNYDPGAEGNEGPVHEVTLSPFFLSKYEMTQGQWLRFTGRNPSIFNPKTGFGGERTTLLHPVESMSWTTCAETLGRLELDLPTEAQWEYAARVGTTSVWWTGNAKESLAGAASLADSFCKRNGGPSGWMYEEWLDDGHSGHAPVGSYPANAFGLHDVIGNVFEWCRDWFGDYGSRVRPGDGEREVGGSARINRGGGFNCGASNARSAERLNYAPESASFDLGTRPARSISP